jgi:uncharacterized membrane protein YeaQ/YmgE (transglycosylase-associated protein family)
MAILRQRQNSANFERGDDSERDQETATNRGQNMTWTLTNLIIQIVAGVIGGYAAAAAMHEHSFGTIGHGLAGAIGGLLSGYFLQTLVITVVNASGGYNQHDAVTDAFLQALTGLVAGAIAIGAIVKHSIEHHRAHKPPAQS